MPWDEDDLHRWLAKAPKPSLLIGSASHDAAVLRRPGGREVVCVDACIEGIHFASDTPAARAGGKAVNRALSDLAATAATPHAILLALCAPRSRSEAWMRAAIGGVRRAASAAGAELVAGDLSAIESSSAQLVVTAIGTLPGRRTPPGRERARPGQVLVLTGPVGGSGLGRHLSFEPRLAEGRALFQAGATAMMDVSDGLAWDLWRLARTAGVRLELECVPLHRAAQRAARASGRSAMDHGLHDGEDHELIACLPARAKLPQGVQVIGRVVRGSGLELSESVAQSLDGSSGARDWQVGEGGWRHGT